MFTDTGDNAILLLILLFVFMGGNTFDVTQLLLALALFSTIGGENCCCGNSAVSSATA